MLNRLINSGFKCR